MPINLRTLNKPMYSNDLLKYIKDLFDAELSKTSLINKNPAFMISNIEPFEVEILRFVKPLINSV